MFSLYKPYEIKTEKTFLAGGESQKVGFQDFGDKPTDDTVLVR